MSQVNIAIVGLGFGAEFIPIYQQHPHANVHAICRRNEAELHKTGDQFEIANRYTSYDDVLADASIDYVHINSPIEDHAWMSLKALDAGKHVMCTVPMATTIDECRQIVEKVQETGLKYMMAETVVYSREYLFIKEMYEKGELGDIQHLAASHPQDMDGWPEYWQEMIPMHYVRSCYHNLMLCVHRFGPQRLLILNTLLIRVILVPFFANGLSRLTHLSQLSLVYVHMDTGHNCFFKIAE